MGKLLWTLTALFIIDLCNYLSNLMCNRAVETFDDSTTSQFTYILTFRKNQPPKSKSCSIQRVTLSRQVFLLLLGEAICHFFYHQTM